MEHTICLYSPIDSFVRIATNEETCIRTSFSIADIANKHEAGSLDGFDEAGCKILLARS